MTAGPGSRYAIHKDHPDEPRVVELWSETRLPFEPSATIKVMRNELRDAVRTLQAHDTEHLQATYASAATGFCDTENVLFYNVGVGFFSDAARNGVRFERAYSIPERNTALGWTPLHYHRYEIGKARATPSRWRAQRTIATWKDVEIGPLTESSSASSIWHMLRPTEAVVTPDTAAKTQRFGIRLAIRVPTGATVNACAITKPLLDGAIAACHSHDGTELDQIASRLAVRLGVGSAEISARLMSAERAALGRRRLLYLRASGVQWNPADDLCMTSALTIDRSAESGRSWSISGELFEVVDA